MSTAAAYFKAAIPEPFTVLGLRLKPFSLGHYILMARFECAFASEAPVSFPATRAGLRDAAENLILAVLICSKSYDEFIQLISESNYQRRVSKWRKEVGPFNILQKVELFKNYMLAGMQMPKFCEKEEGGTSGAHWTQSVKVILTGELGYTIQQAMDTPLAQSMADYFKWAENKGLIELLSDHDLEQIAALEKEALSQTRN